MAEKRAAKRLRQNLGMRDDNPYNYPKKAAAEWYELDNLDERIHGSVRFADSDDFSPHDPEVADAPEDMKRVGNDHEELHNAKLAPDGYYNGFFHKDYEGNYVQKHRRGGYNDYEMVQVSDHDNDSDDIPYSYEADGARAMPNDKSDFELVQIRDGTPKEWGAYLQHQANLVISDQKKVNDEMERIYAQEEDEGSYEYV